VDGLHGGPGSARSADAPSGASASSRPDLFFGFAKNKKPVVPEREFTHRFDPEWTESSWMVLEAAGRRTRSTPHSRRWLEEALSHEDGLDATTAQRLEQCYRMQQVLTEGLEDVERRLRNKEPLC